MKIVNIIKKIKKLYLVSWWIQFLFVIFVVGIITFFLAGGFKQINKNNLIAIWFGIGILSLITILPMFILLIIGLIQSNYSSIIEQLNISKKKYVLMWIINLWFLIILIKFLNSNKNEFVPENFNKTIKNNIFWSILQVIWIAMEIFEIINNNLKVQPWQSNIVAMVCTPLILILMCFLFHKFVKQSFFALQLDNKQRKERIMSFIPVINNFVFIRNNLNTN